MVYYINMCDRELLGEARELQCKLLDLLRIQRFQLGYDGIDAYFRIVNNLCPRGGAFETPEELYLRRVSGYSIQELIVHFEIFGPTMPELYACVTCTHIHTDDTNKPVPKENLAEAEKRCEEFLRKLRRLDK